MNAPIHLWIIPLLPLTGAAINGLFGRRFSRRLIAAIALGAAALAVAAALYAIVQHGGSSTCAYVEDYATWIAIPGAFNVHFAFQLDPLSTLMILIVSGIGF